MRKPHATRGAHPIRIERVANIKTFTTGVVDVVVMKLDVAHNKVSTDRRIITRRIGFRHDAGKTGIRYLKMIDLEIGTQAAHLEPLLSGNKFYPVAGTGSARNPEILAVFRFHRVTLTRPV